MAELTFLKIAKRNKGLYVALAGLLIAAIVINFATGVNFFKISNLLNVTRSFCILAIASIGMLLGAQQEVGCSVYDRYYKELAKKIKAQD